jgi:phosphate/sulfate permease
MRTRLEYWRMVWRRAWREAVAAAPWSSSVKLIAAILVAGVAFAWGWHDSGRPSMGAVWVLAASGAATFGAVLFKLWWAVPADMSAESERCLEDLRKTLATHNSAEPDALVEEAIGYILLHEWNSSYPSNLEAEILILQKLRELAFQGKIEIWGRLSAFALHKIVPREIWETAGVDLERFWQADQPVQTEKLWDEVNKPYRYINLKVVRAQIEREWVNVN